MTFKSIPVVMALALAAVPAAAGEPATRDTAAHLPPRDCVHLLRQARIAEMRQDQEAALGHLRQAAAAHPRELAVIHALWEFYTRHELSGDERTRLRVSMHDLLADPDTPLHFGTLRHMVVNPDLDPGEMRWMLDAAQARLAAGAANPRLLEAIGILQQRLGLLAETRDTLRRLLQAEPLDRWRWALLDLSRKLEQWDEVCTLLRELADREDASPFTVMALVEALAKAGRYDELVVRLDELDERVNRYDVSIQSTRRALLLQAAWDLRDLGREAQAEAIFRRILTINPHDDEALAVVLHLYSSEEERAQHEAELRDKRAAETDPHNLLDEGAQLLAAGNAAGALELLERAARALPASEIAWFNLGLAALRLERWERAESAFAAAIRLNPQRVDARLNRGIALSKLERCEEAIAELREAQRMQADLNAANFYLYTCHKAMGHETEAVQALERYNAGRE